MNDFWKKRRVFVTGANGFLASWMVKELLRQGAHVVSLVFAKNPVSLFEQERLDQKTETILGDVRDIDLLKRLCQKYSFDTIFHVGAQAICSSAENDPLSTLDINIQGTYHILDAVRTVSPSTHVIVASSDKAYGIHEKLPYEEDFPLHGEYPYEVSKTCADLITTMYWRTYGLPVSIVRCGNLYGGGDAHFSRLIPATIRLLSMNKSPLIIENSTRDFLYVEDAMRGYLMLAEQMAGEPTLYGHAFNFGTETPRCVVDVINMIIVMMGKQHIVPTLSVRSQRGIPNQLLSYQKAKKRLAWEPLVHFDDGLRRTVQWYCDYFSRDGSLDQPMLTSYNLFHPDFYEKEKSQ